MDFEICQIARPNKRRQVVNHDVIDVRMAAVSTGNRKCPNPIRRELRRVFFIEELTADAIRKPLQCDRPVAEMRQDKVGHPNVIVDDLPLCEMRGREENLIEIR